MATGKKAKTAQTRGAAQEHTCEQCGEELRVVMYAGYGRKGMFWQPDKTCKEEGCRYPKRAG